MRILFVAKHGCGDNQDEDAITHALTQLGHEVTCVHELRRHRTPDRDLTWALVQGGPFDFCLFAKWEDVGEIRRVSERMPCVGWYFDLVSCDDDPTLTTRMATRRQWFWNVLPYCLAMFCTDGTWVERCSVNTSEHGKHGSKLHWLMQGMDERVAGFGTPPVCDACDGEGLLMVQWAKERCAETGGYMKRMDDGSPVYYTSDHKEIEFKTIGGPCRKCQGLKVAPDVDILFTGMVNHGQKRAQHVAELRARYGERFQVLGDAGPRHRVHGRELADLFARTKVVIAPDGPCTDSYWSNRVYLTLGLGGFLLHPRCKGLDSHYEPRHELVPYYDRDDLIKCIDWYLDRPDARESYRNRGYQATIQRNLYRHRCAELIEVVKGLI